MKKKKKKRLNFHFRKIKINRHALCSLQTHTHTKRTQTIHTQKKMKENERVGGEDGEENECPDLYGALNVENTATSIEVRVFFDLSFFLHHSNVQKNSLK